MGACQSSPATVTAASSCSPPESSKNQPEKKRPISPTKKKTEASTVAAAATVNINNATPAAANTKNSSQQHNRSPSQDVSIGSNFSSSNSNTNSNSSDDDHSNNDTNRPPHQILKLNSLSTGNINNSNNNNSARSLDLSTSHRRRKSRHFDHSDSRVGLHEIISGDLKNPNLVRIEVPLGKPIEEVYEGVHDGPVLGSGISGIVRLVKHRKTGVQYAVKCLDLALIDSEEGLKQLKEEIYIMCQLVSVNACIYYTVYDV